MPDWLPYILAAAGGYLMGSVPFGLVIARAAGLGDIREIGSGNIGATNVLRTGRKDLALATLLLDIFKAGLATLLFAHLFADRNVGLIAGAAAFLGHCYPIWLGFKGGKGVATYAGLLGFISWKVFVLGFLIWLAMFAVTRISSLSALVVGIIVPVAAYLFGETQFAIITLALLSALVFWTHRSNIGRLMHGEEPRSRFGAKKT